MRRLRKDGNSERYTWSQVRDRAVRAAFYLAASGVDPGDRVMLLSENRPEWGMAFFGAIKAAATVVPVDHEASPDEIENLIASSGAVKVIASAKVLERLGSPERLGNATFVEITELFSAPVPDVGEGELAPRDPVDLASLIFTSGTTGTPKGVMLSGRNFTSLVSRLSGVFNLGERDGLLSVLPLHHTFEFTAGFLVPLACGAEIAYVEEVNGDL